MPDNTPKPGFIAALFSKLLFGGKNRDEEAAAARQAAMSAAGVLERLLAAPQLPDDIRPRLSPLVRLLYIWVHARPEHLAQQGEALHAAAALAERAASSIAQSAALPAAFSSEIHALTLRLQKFPDEMSSDLPAESETPASLPQRLTALEFKDTCKALQQTSQQLPPEMRILLERILTAAQTVARHSDGSSGAHRFLKRYLGAAQQVADGIIAVGNARHSLGEQQEIVQRSMGVLSRIADAFEAQTRAADERKRDDFSADLAVIDTLLRIDGK